MSPSILKREHLLTLVFLLLLTHRTECSETLPISGRLVVPDGKLGEVWVGVFHTTEEGLVASGDWTLVSSEDFVLDAPKQENLKIVAFRKDYLPAVKDWSDLEQANPVTFKFERGAILRGQVLSSDGLGVPGARLTLESSDFLVEPFPDQVSLSWETDEDGYYVLTGLAPGTHKLALVARDGFPAETFYVKTEGSDNLSRDLALEDAYFATGQVVDFKNLPFSGANVSGRLGREELVTTSDDRGQFRLGPFRMGSRLDIKAWSQVGGSSRVHSVRPPRHDLPLALSDTVHVQGQIWDAETRDPVEQYKLYAIRNMFPVVESTRTGSGGKLSEKVDAKTKLLLLESPGYPPKFWQVDFAADRDHDLGRIVLQRGKSLEGRVIDGDDGAPIADATIQWWVHDQLIEGDLREVFIRNEIESEGILGSLYSTATRHLANSITTKSDSDGDFTLGPLPHDNVQLLVLASEYEARTFDVAESENQVDLVLQRRATVEADAKLDGRVESTLGLPVQGFVTIRNSETQMAVRRETQEEGSFELAIEPGSYEIRAETDYGYTNTVHVNVLEGDEEQVRLVVYTRGSLVLSIEGLQGIETATLTIDGIVPRQPPRHKRELANGTHMIEGLRPGSYRVSAETSTGRRIARSVTISEEESEAHLEIEFSGTSRLFGTLLKRESFSSRPFRVLVEPLERSATSGWGEVYNDGSYEVHGLDDGEYLVSVQWFDPTATSLEIEMGEVEQTRRGPIRKVEIAGDTRLDLEMGMLDIEGTVGPAPETEGADVRLRRDWHESGNAQVDSAGRFRISHLSAGEYVLSVYHDDFYPARKTLSVEGSISDFTIVLRRKEVGSLVIAGKVEPLPESRDVWVSLARAEDATHVVASIQTDSQGNFRFEGLAPDVYELSVLHDGFKDKQLSLRNSIHNVLLGKELQSNEHEVTGRD